MSACTLNMTTNEAGSDKLTGLRQSNRDADGDVVTLRDGEQPDDSHAARNAAMLRTAERVLAEDGDGDA